MNAATGQRSVGLVIVQGYIGNSEADRLHELVRQVCGTLNTFMDQGDLKFRSYANERILSDVEPSGPRGREYEQSEYWTRLIDKRKEFNVDYVIGICGMPLDESSFNLESRGDSVGIISNVGFDQFAPPGMTIDRFLMYLVICVALLLDNDGVKEHREPEGCLFDECRPVEQITAGLRKPSLKHCRSDFHRDDQYLEPFEHALQFVGYRDPLAVITSTIGQRASGYLLGVFGAFASNMLVSESPRAALVLLWVSIATVGMLLVSRWLRRYQWVDLHSRRVFWSVAAATVIAVAAGSYVIVGQQTPRLKSDDASETSCIREPTSAPNAFALRCR